MKTRAVKLTENFERNLNDIEEFHTRHSTPAAFDDLLKHLAATVIPNIERFPGIGRSFLSRPIGSAEGDAGVRMLHDLLKPLDGATALREYVFLDYLALYLDSGDTAYLLAIRHHRQLSFDLHAAWLTGPA